MPDVVASNGRLVDLARNIKSEYEKGRTAYASAMDSYISMGHQLRKARGLIASDTEFGRWFKKQEFPFSPAWARTLREAAENEGEIRTEVASQLASGRAANIEKAVRAVVPPVPKPKAVEPAPVAPAGYTIKPPPPAPVQGPDDHTYDFDHFTATGVLGCLLGCPGPEPHNFIQDVGVQGGVATVEGPELTDLATGLSPNPSVGEVEGTGVVAVDSGPTGNPVPDAHPSTPGEVPPRHYGVAGVGSVGPVPRAVDAPEVRASEPSTEELDSHNPDYWTVTVLGTDSDQFRALCEHLENLDCTWSYAGPASFTVDAQ